MNPVVVGVTPLLWCVDCGLAALRDDATGLIKGVRDVDPCPGGSDDFHYWIGVLPSSCTNPLHDHDAVTDPQGNGDPTTNLCNGCPAQIHYDRSLGWYFHDDPDAEACFLSGPNADNPCTTEAS